MFGTFHIGIGKTGKTVEVDFEALAEHVQRHVVEYGVRQILNDARASAKTDEEAIALVEKRLANLVAGTLRASPNRIGNPVAVEAMRIALAKVRAAPKFKAWVAENGLKIGDKSAVAKAKELAQALASREDILDQAAANVAATAELEVDIDL